VKKLKKGERKGAGTLGPNFVAGGQGRHRRKRGTSPLANPQVLCFAVSRGWVWDLVKIGGTKAGELSKNRWGKVPGRRKRKGRGWG